MDPAQILLILVIIILTILLVVLGIQVYFVLKELRITLRKVSNVLDNTDEITRSIANPISSLSTLLMGLKAGGSLSRIIKKVSEDK